MRLVFTTVCCLVIGTSGALAQSGGGASSGGGSTSSGGATGRAGGAPSAARSAPSPIPTGPPPSPGANTPVDPQRNNVDANPPTQRLPGTTANSPNGSTQPGAPSQATPQGTVSSSGRPDPSGANSSPNSTRTGKNPAQEAIADCVRLWDAGTHMTKGEWLATCRRVQGRLDNLKVDPVAPKTASKRERSSRAE
jgi:hypothetical protein